MMTRDDAVKMVMGDCNTITPINLDDEGYFSWRGCDICNKVEGKILGNTVIDCHGYNPKTKEIEELGRICPHCLYYIEYGEES